MMPEMDNGPIVNESYGSEKKRYCYFLDGQNIYQQANIQRKFASLWDTFQVSTNLLVS